MHIFKARHFVSSLLAYLRRDLLLYIVVAIYAGCGYLYAWVNGVSVVPISRQYLWPWTLNFLVIYPAISVMLSVIYIVHRFDARRRLAFRQMLFGPRLARAVAGILFLIWALLFQTTFTCVKIATAQPAGFLYDRALADIDRLVHFGHQPFVLVHAILGHAWLRSVVEVNYDVVWFILCYGLFFWVAISRRADGIRTHYMLAFLASWIVIGNVFAGFFTSAGPAFYGLVTGDKARFQALASFLADARGETASAADVQRYLWDAYTSGAPGIGTGISAFPSMHVSLVILNALFVFHYDRRYGLIAFGYAGFIMMSSVLLGWHYAIDGYIGLALTTIIYVGTKPLAAWLQRLSNARSGSACMGRVGTLTAS